MSYHDLLAAVAIRVNALYGATAATMEATYNTRPLTSTLFTNPAFPFSSCKQALLNAEGKLVHAIANTAGHEWRVDLAAVTGTLGDQAVLPTQSAAGKEIIGVLGSVYDALDGTALTLKPLAVVRRRTRNANSFFRCAAYHYYIDDRRIFHTRPGVMIDVCVYDRDAQKNLIDADGAVLLSPVLEEAYICGAVSMLVRDDEYTTQAGIYRSYFDATLQMIHQGFTTVPSSLPNEGVAAA